MQTPNVGYVVNGVGASALAAIAALDPQTVTQLLGYLAALGVHVSSPQITAGLAIVGLLTNQVMLHRAHNEQPTGAPSTPTNPQGGFATLSFRWLLVTISALILVAGCASFQQNAPTAQLGVKVATMKVIEAKPASGFPVGATPTQRAAKVRELATAAQSFFDSSTATLPGLQAAIETRLGPLNLAPSDRLLADMLVQTVVAELHVRVGDGTLSADQIYQVKTVLGWVIDATNYYGS